MDRAGAAELEAMIEAHLGEAGSARDAAAIGAGVESQVEAGSAKRVILVDGFNVLHAVLLGKDRETGWWQTEARERLLRRASGWPDLADEVWVAFDGAQPAWSVWAEPVARIVPRTTASAAGPILHSVYVESADDWIVRRARRAARPERTVVVSGDHKVAGRARSAGCEVWTPWAFVSRCPNTENATDGGGAATAPSPRELVNRSSAAPSCVRSTTD